MSTIQQARYYRAIEESPNTCLLHDAPIDMYTGCAECLDEKNGAMNVPCGGRIARPESHHFERQFHTDKTRQRVARENEVVV